MGQHSALPGPEIPSPRRTRPEPAKIGNHFSEFHPQKPAFGRNQTGILKSYCILDTRIVNEVKNATYTSSRIQLLNILLVEDDEVDVMNVKRSFRKNKIAHQLHVASDGIDALERLRSNEIPLPQVILLDINMPRMGGLEFLREIRKDPKLNTIMVFIMSTSDNPIDKSNAFRHNVAGYIVKPLSAEKFNQALSRLAAFWDICEFP